MIKNAIFELIFDMQISGGRVFQIEGKLNIKVQG